MLETMQRETFFCRDYTLPWIAMTIIRCHAVSNDDLLNRPPNWLTNRKRSSARSGVACLLEDQREVRYSTSQSHAERNSAFQRVMLSQLPFRRFDRTPCGL